MKMFDLCSSHLEEQNTLNEPTTIFGILNLVGVSNDRCRRQTLKGTMSTTQQRFPFHFLFIRNSWSTQSTRLITDFRHYEVEKSLLFMQRLESGIQHTDTTNSRWTIQHVMFVLSFYRQTNCNIRNIWPTVCGCSRTLLDWRSTKYIAVWP